MIMRGHREPTMSVTIDGPWQGLFNYYPSGSPGGHTTGPVARQSVTQPMAPLK